MKKLNHLFKAEKFRNYELSAFSDLETLKVMNMKEVVFTDKMAYQCDHCFEPWNCKAPCEKIGGDSYE